ncbi:hypothetical protein L7F22_022617 [Adiantum nelumboides]|nr:hypothetical protein [Adiantum nelumboides]
MTARDAVSLFRGLLRARRKCFAGDVRMLKESHSQIRASFDQNRHVSDPSRLDQLFLEGQEAIHVLTNLIVQGKLNERGNIGKPKDYKEGGQGVKFDTVHGTHDKLIPTAV